MRRLKGGVLALMLAITELLAGGRGAHAADSILTEVLRRGTVRIAITAGAPPTRFEDEKGNLQGYDIDIANYLAKQLGVTIDYIRTDTAGATISGSSSIPGPLSWRTVCTDCPARTVTPS